MVGKQVVIDFLLRKGIAVLFHLPGIHTLSLNQALTGSGIETFMGRHESNLAYMAAGYARTSGKPGVVMVTPGPGLGNIVAGCMEAFGDELPLLIVHVDTERKDVGKGILHEVSEPESLFAPITKKTFLVEGSRDLAEKLEEAYSVMTAGRKGPVLISIPYTIFDKRAQGTSPVTEGARGPSTPDPDLSGAEEALRGKTRPLFIAGRALMNEETPALLDEICSDRSIPLLTSTSGKGVVRDDRPYVFGNMIRKGLAREIISSADVVIAVGTRLRDVDSKRRGVRIGELIHADTDEFWMGKNYPARARVVGEPVKTLKGLLRLLEERRFEWDLDLLQRKKREEETLMARKHHGFRMVRLLRSVLPEETTVVCDLNLPSYWAEYYFPVFFGHTFLMPRGISPIFYSLPAAIGAKIGQPERPCLCLCGDGGVLPAVAEMATIKKYGIPVVILVHNNNSFGILEDAVTAAGGEMGTMELVNPDFVRLAGAFGIRARRARNLESLERIFVSEVTWDEPFLVEYASPVFPPPWRVE